MHTFIALWTAACIAGVLAALGTLAVARDRTRAAIVVGLAVQMVTLIALFLTSNRVVPQPTPTSLSAFTSYARSQGYDRIILWQGEGPLFQSGSEPPVGASPRRAFIWGLVPVSRQRFAAEEYPPSAADLRRIAASSETPAGGIRRYPDVVLSDAQGPHAKLIINVNTTKATS